MSIECIQIKYDGHRIILILIIDTYLRYILRHREKIGEIKVTFVFSYAFLILEYSINQLERINMCFLGYSNTSLK